MRHEEGIVGEILAQLGHRTPAVFLDYDGTLTPIVRRPEAAVMSQETRRIVRDLARHVPVAVVSGRDLKDVKRRVDLHHVYYAGSHGFDIEGPPGRGISHEAGALFLPVLDAAEAELEAVLEGVEGAILERKRFTIAIHYREVPETGVGTVASAVERVRRSHQNLRKTDGKQVFELQPDMDWHKGKAVRWLLENAVDPGRGAAIPIYIGDDVTDEDAFRELEDDGIGIFVGDGAASRKTRARYTLTDTGEVRRFLKRLCFFLCTLNTFNDPHHSNRDKTASNASMFSQRKAWWKRSSKISGS
jgi:alpha,alpha-trehalase